MGRVAHSPLIGCGGRQRGSGNWWIRPAGRTPGQQLAPRTTQTKQSPSNGRQTKGKCPPATHQALHREQRGPVKVKPRARQRLHERRGRQVGGHKGGEGGGGEEGPHERALAPGGGVRGVRPEGARGGLGAAAGRG